MIVFSIDTSVSSNFSFSVNVGESVVKLHFLWNLRNESWYCDFKSSYGENNGVKLVVGSGLLGKKNRVTDNGDFRIVKSSADAEDHITYDNLGNGYSLVYGTNEEWEAFDGAV